MSGMSMGHSHPRPCSGKKTLRRCKNNVEADNVILIDVDSENCDNVVIIDITDSLPKENQELHVLKKDEKWPFRNVINIDDDETPDSRPFGVNNASFSAGTSFNRESFRVASNFGDSSDDDCQFVHESSTPVRLSKCKRTYSGKASRKNHYGLDTDSECDLSDSDYPDCDVVEDFSGEVQAMWEKAFSRRMKGINNVHSGSKGHDSTSHCINEDHQNVESRSSFETEANQGKAFPGDNHSLVQEKATGIVDEREKGECKKSMWGKSFSRRMKGINNVHSGSKGHDSTSHCINEDHQNVESRNSFETEANQGKAFPGDNHSLVQEMATGIVDEREKWECKKSHTTVGATETGSSPTPSCKAVDGSGKSLLSKSFLSSVKGKKGSHKENGPLVPEIPFLNEAEHHGNDSVSNIDACIINDRERLKETDEYKRAIEEEWASRQQALQIQAEEAQNQRRLRKRIKAESMRLLDMERRQKQRLEEVRSIQKKDVENMNLKDTVRAEVRIELKKLEVGCQNMASLLHSLGIRVDGWPKPSPQEVQAAYKRALLSFHPDRASRSDIRQLVEAEEKFKLINRMKEKFPPSL